VGNQRRHVVGMRGDERERGHRAAAAREQLDRPGTERLDHGMDVLRLDRRVVIDAAVRAHAAAEAARVVGDHGPVREVRRQRGEAGGVHRLADQEQGRASVGGRQRAADVVGNGRPGGVERVCGRHASFDGSRIEKSSMP
jgi:hypothetical protein